MAEHKAIRLEDGSILLGIKMSEEEAINFQRVVGNANSQQHARALAAMDMDLQNGSGAKVGADYAAYTEQMELAFLSMVELGPKFNGLS